MWTDRQIEANESLNIHPNMHENLVHGQDTIFNHEDEAIGTAG